MLLLLLASLLFAWLTISFGIGIGAAILVAIITIPVVYGIVAYPSFGIIILLVMAYLLFFIMRFNIPFPLGTVMDGIQALLVLGLFIQQKKDPNWGIFKGPVSIMVLIWIAYNLLEAINPVAESRLAWLYTVRSVAVVMLVYFVFKYQIRTVRFIRIIIRLWLGLAALAALYCLKQEYIGYSDSELAYLYSDPLIASLLFIDGHWRKSSILSDPVAFSYNMVVAGMICIGLISGVKKIKAKILLVFLIGLYWLAMLYSGTRGAYVLIPAGLALYAILNYNKLVLQFSIVAAIVIAILIFIPTTNPTLYRFQTAFRPSEDASFNVRKINQKRIQPYILSHPMGGGLGATGVWGIRFAPYSFLANFPPDSGYTRVAVEMGWIGLFIFCLLMFYILKVGITNYYAIQDKELKSYCLAMTLGIFVLNIGNYPQEALVQFPSSVYIYLMAALVEVTYSLDQKKKLEVL
ncbi:MAG: O-antigen ligase family protein [Siphonobacter sp.]